MDIYLSAILRPEQDLRMGIWPSPYQQLFEIKREYNIWLSSLRELKDNSNGLTFP